MSLPCHSAMFKKYRISFGTKDFNSIVHKGLMYQSIVQQLFYLRHGNKKTDAYCWQIRLTSIIHNEMNTLVFCQSVAVKAG